MTGMLEPMDFRDRRGRLADAVDEAGFDGLYVTDPADLAWCTGYTGSNAALLVLADATAVFTTDARYEGQVEPVDGLEVVIDRDLFAMVVDRAGEDDRIAFDPAAVTHARALTWFERLDDGLVGRGGLVAKLRLRKDADEVARLQRACALTVAAWRDVVVDALESDDLVGRTERDVATAIERRMVDLGADGVAFDSIVAAGPNGAVPHHRPGDRPIRPGEFVTTDIGARVDGYHADFTRTVASDDSVSDTLLRVHDVVARAQQAGIEALQVGDPIVDVDSAARDVIVAAGNGDQFVHGVGHGVGLVIHEDPFIALAGDDVLEAGMCLTVEPGIYLPGVGGVRIEDTLVVTEQGPRHLTVAATGPRPLG
ncbi:MAG TPA: aminopeptidase P family protein [Nitriliruptoraceae bacterium]|nr:aminopeptidase P family protein [Nitriliruptoraceae bacterium]